VFCERNATEMPAQEEERMKLKILSVLVVCALFMTAAYAESVFTAKLAGVHETPLVVSGGSGTARLTISDDEKSIKYELTYSGLEGSVIPNGKVLFAHVHVGQKFLSGGVAVFFCGGGKTPATQAACPASGTVSGTWTAADIVGPTSQGVDPTDSNQDSFARLVNAIKHGQSYANVHSTRSPGGEIRGQLHRVHDDDDDKDKD
jgi:CHRD domain